MKKSVKFPQFVEFWRWFQLPSETRLHLPDVLMFVAGLALFYGVLAIGRTWFGPLTPELEISRSVWSLPAYAGYSLLRIGVAYAVSLAFTLVYGYVAANNPKAERFMIPLLDVLQSIPVLSFLPGVMLAMVALFPRHQIGVEFGSILLIFTGQVWNMAFSFYASLKSIPREMREASRIYRFSAWQRFTQVELPFASIGLVWNSMISVAGGWFFLMACEMFVLGKRDFRLPGLGSYLQTAAQCGRHFRNCVGHHGNDCRHCPPRPAGLETCHCLGRKVQSRTDRECRFAEFVLPACLTPLAFARTAEPDGNFAGARAVASSLWASQRT
jgi:ABC-type nitrate/sulfonate/bicarbonate transport system permease component